MSPEMDSGWEQVRITVHYVERGITKAQIIDVSRSDMERDMQRALNAGKGSVESAPIPTLSPDAFRGRVLRIAEELASSPVRVPGQTSTSVRILPPWAVKEVEVDPAGVSKILTLS